MNLTKQRERGGGGGIKDVDFQASRRRINSTAVTNCVHQYDCSPKICSPRKVLTNSIVDSNAGGLACKMTNTRTGKKSSAPGAAKMSSSSLKVSPCGSCDAAASREAPVKESMMLRQHCSITTNMSLGVCRQRVKKKDNDVLMKDDKCSRRIEKRAEKLKRT